MPPAHTSALMLPFFAPYSTADMQGISNFPQTYTMQRYRQCLQSFITFTPAAYFCWLQSHQTQAPQDPPAQHHFLRNSTALQHGAALSCLPPAMPHVHTPAASPCWLQIRQPPTPQRQQQASLVMGGLLCGDPLHCLLLLLLLLLVAARPCT